MCSTIESGERGNKWPEQILFSSLASYLTLLRHLLFLFRLKEFDHPFFKGAMPFESCLECLSSEQSFLVRKIDK